MIVLALNPGSSSLKFGVYKPGGDAGPVRTIELTSAGEISDAVARAIETVGETRLDGVGCRVVHGGPGFVAPVLVNEGVLREIRALSTLAPLHNPLAVATIETVHRLLPGVPVVAAFDTAFHATLPEHAFTYAVPAALQVRRYGFHGLSYSYLSSQLPALGVGSRVIACHLGNGASVCAMRDGESVDTSMGMTPLEGLVMGTRAGDLDPGVLLELLRRGMTGPDLEELLSHRSGLLGLSETSGDVRDLEQAAAKGDGRAALALNVFSYRVAKYIGAYAAVLGGVDALVFTAGIGEHSPQIRSRICAPLRHLGIELDPSLNSAAGEDARSISAGEVAVWVVPTDEELELARLTRKVLAINPGEPETRP